MARAGSVERGRPTACFPVHLDVAPRVSPGSTAISTWSPATHVRRSSATQTVAFHGYRSRQRDERPHALWRRQTPSFLPHPRLRMPRTRHQPRATWGRRRRIVPVASAGGPDAGSGVGPDCAIVQTSRSGLGTTSRPRTRAKAATRRRQPSGRLPPMTGSGLEAAWLVVLERESALASEVGQTIGQATWPRATAECASAVVGQVGPVASGRSQ